MIHVMKKPPAMKLAVATREGHCRDEMPMMEWPEVQPPAYRVPKPTRKPPRIKNSRPLSVNNV